MARYSVERSWRSRTISHSDIQSSCAQQRVVDAVEVAAHEVERSRIERDLGVGVVAVVGEDELAARRGRAPRRSSVLGPSIQAGDRLDLVEPLRSLLVARATSSACGRSVG